MHDRSRKTKTYWSISARRYRRALIDRNELVLRLLPCIFAHVISFEDIKVDFRSKLDPEITRRVQRVGLMLVQELRKAIKNATRVSGGAQSSGGALTSDTKLEANLVRLQMGLGASGDYLKYRLGGVSPAPGAVWPGFSKLPNLGALLKWTKLSGLSVPQWAQNMADANAKRSASPRKHPKFTAKKDAPWNSSDKYVVWSFGVAQSIKAHGIKPLEHKSGGKMMKTLLELQQAKILSLIEGAVA